MAARKASTDAQSLPGSAPVAKSKKARHCPHCIKWQPGHSSSLWNDTSPPQNGHGFNSSLFMHYPPSCRRQRSGPGSRACRTLGNARRFPVHRRRHPCNGLRATRRSSMSHRRCIRGKRRSSCSGSTDNARSCFTTFQGSAARQADKFVQVSSLDCRQLRRWGRIFR